MKNSWCSETCIMRKLGKYTDNGMYGKSKSRYLLQFMEFENILNFYGELTTIQCTKMVFIS